MGWKQQYLRRSHALRLLHCFFRPCLSQLWQVGYTNMAGEHGPPGKHQTDDPHSPSGGLSSHGQCPPKTHVTTPAIRNKTAAQHWVSSGVGFLQHLGESRLGHNPANPESAIWLVIWHESRGCSKNGISPMTNETNHRSFPIERVEKADELIITTSSFAQDLGATCRLPHDEFVYLRLF